MSELLKPFGAPSEPVVDSADFPEPVASSVEAAEASTRGPVLITEQEVLFGTAVVALPPTKIGRFSDALQAVAVALRSTLASAAKPPAPRRYPKRHVWLENALMAREMDRL